MRHLIILLALLCVSCNASLPSIKPFKMDIQQGNVVTSKMMLQLKPGMTKSQVRFIMGTPLIQDGFHPDRWDYFYQMRKAGKIVEQRRVIMDFENDALVRIRGDVIPAGTGEDVADPQPVTPAKSKKSEKSLLDRLKFWEDDEEATKPQAVPEDLVTPATGAPAVADDPAPPSAPVTQQPAEPEPIPPAPTEPTPPALESKPIPAEEAPAADEPAVEPMLMPTEPTPAPEMAPIKSGEPVPVVPPADAAPATESTPAPEPPPAVAPASEPESAPADQSEVQQPANEPQPAPKDTDKSTPELESADDLPPEGDPGYFERMLEKIGF